MATAQQLRTIAHHYLQAAIWANAPEGTNPRATKSAEEKALADCTAFVIACGDLFEQAMACKENGYGAWGQVASPEAAFGHDFFFERNGHGVGFWDRDELPQALRDALSELCDKYFPETYIDIANGWFYLTGIE